MTITWPVKNLSYKKLIVIPLIVTAILGSAVILKGVPLGIDFSSGASINVKNVENVPETTTEIRKTLEKDLGGSVQISLGDNEINVETSFPLTEELENKLKSTLSEKFGIDGQYSIPKRTFPAITALYIREAKKAVIIAAIAMAIILFISLRHIPTVGGILSVIGLDATVIFGGMSILNIPLTLSSMAGILLIFGYAVNTNVLLSSHVLKRVGGTVRERAANAMSTGLVMSTTSATALIVLNIVASPDALKQLSAVIVIGILADMMNTWLFNSGLIMKQAEKQEAKYSGRI